MGKKIVNIDDILAANSLEIQIKDKSYVVRDLLLSEFLESMAALEENDVKAQHEVMVKYLAMAFECNPDELKDFGMKTLLTIFLQVRNWILEDTGELPKEPGGETPSENP